MAENNIKVGDLVTCNSSHGLSFHNCKVVDILDDGLIKAKLPTNYTVVEILDNGRIKVKSPTLIRYVIARNDQVELQNVRDEEEIDDTNN